MRRESETNPIQIEIIMKRENEESSRDILQTHRLETETKGKNL